jgi:predicted polyphosphate/ATP-dependent NAD kinase
MSMTRPVAGIIANPVSARDIRRVIANAASLQITDRANIVLRLLASLKACGVEQAVMMPERGGILHFVQRALDRAKARHDEEFPELRILDCPVTGTVADTIHAAGVMKAQGVAAIAVLGGDGTHRAVVSTYGDIPIAGISTGTNNAFPEHREPTITGLALGLAMTGRVPAHIAYLPNKKLTVAINGEDREIALVDAAIVTERYVGARALWRTETFRDLIVTFADPEAIGMSAIAGLLEPVTRAEQGGLIVDLMAAEDAEFAVSAPIGPGLVRTVGVAGWKRFPAGAIHVPRTPAGSIALDGEREISFTEKDRLEVRLDQDAFRTVNTGAIMQYAARHGLLRQAQSRVTRRSVS